MAKLDLGALFVKIGVNMGDVDSAINKITSKFERLSSRLDGIGKKLSVGISAPLAAAGGAAFKMATDATESENLFEVSMGRMAGSARKWSESLRKQFGLNAYEVRKNVGTFDVMLGSMGMTEKAAFGMSKGMTQLAYDMASFYNLSNNQAFEKLRAGISGETEPLKALGININETMVQQYAWNNGIAKTGEQLSELQKVMARYGLILTSTSKAQGDLGRTMDSPANKLRIMQSRLQNVAITAGQTLIPVFEQVVAVIDPLISQLDKAIDRFQALPESMQKTIVMIALILTALGPVLILFGKAVDGAGALITVFSSLAKVGGIFKVIGGEGSRLRKVIEGLKAGTMGLGQAFVTLVGKTNLWLIGIAALITAGVLLWRNWDKVKDFFLNMWDSIAAKVQHAVSKIIGYMKPLFGSHAKWAEDLQEGLDAKASGHESNIDTRKSAAKMKEVALERGRQLQKQMDEQKKADELEKMYGIDALKAAMQGVNGLDKLSKKKKEAKTDAEKLSDAIREIDKSLGQLDDNKLAFGDAFDYATEKLNILQDGIKKLIENGLSGASKKVQDLASQLRVLKEQIAIGDVKKDAKTGREALTAGLRSNTFQNRLLGGSGRFLPDVEAGETLQDTPGYKKASADLSEYKRRLDDVIDERKRLLALEREASEGMMNKKLPASERSAYKKQLEQYIRSQLVNNGREAQSLQSNVSDLEKSIQGMEKSADAYRTVVDGVQKAAEDFAEIPTKYADGLHKIELQSEDAFVDPDSTTKRQDPIQKRIEQDQSLLDELDSQGNRGASIYKQYEDEIYELRDALAQAKIEDKVEEIGKTISTLDVNLQARGLKQGSVEWLDTMVKAHEQFQDQLESLKATATDTYTQLTDEINRLSEQLRKARFQDVVRKAVDTSTSTVAVDASVDSIIRDTTRMPRLSEKETREAEIADIVDRINSIKEAGNQVTYDKDGTPQFAATLQEITDAIAPLVGRLKELTAVKPYDALGRIRKGLNTFAGTIEEKGRGHWWSLLANALSFASRQVAAIADRLKNANIKILGIDIGAGIRAATDFVVQSLQGLGVKLVEQSPILNDTITGWSQGKYGKDGKENNGLMGGLVGIFIAIAQHSGTFQNLLALINPLIQAAADALGMLLEPLLPIVQVLVSALAPVIKVISIILQNVLLPIFKALFPIIKLFGLVLIEVAKIAAHVWNALASAVNVLLGWLGVHLDTIKIEELDAAQSELAKMTWDSAMAMAQNANAAKEAADEMKNLPQGFKIALARFQVANQGSGINMDDVPMYGDGATVTGKTLAMIGEKVGSRRSPEQIIWQDPIRCRGFLGSY